MTRRAWALALLFTGLSAPLAADPTATPDATQFDPCSYTATLTFDDAPNYRPGDPARAQKQSVGMNPLQTKQIDIEASETTIKVRVRTHDSFQKFWNYAQKRSAAGIPLSRTDDVETLRGDLTRFIAFPKNRPDQAIDVRVWLDYDSATAYTPHSNVDAAATSANDLPIAPPDTRQRSAPSADIASPIDIVLGLNEAEIRLPTKRFHFEADDEIFFHFKKGDTSVCVPEMD